MALVPIPARVRAARPGAIGATGRLPQGWLPENADTLEIEHVDQGPEGPAITLTLGCAAANAAPFVSVVLGDYLPIVNEDIAVLRVDVEVTRAHAATEGFLVLREWIAGGTYVGQATRPIALDGAPAPAPAVAARMAGGDSRLFQPLVTFRRAGGGEARVTVRLRRVVLASLHDHPGWLSG